ncbi:MAG TPA: TlpA disulfide reductase family protein, partial [Saprospiraceae bacterium]|nr:TlpA disulfide reductase family protein [Saprospiraceae bacterium]
IGLPAPDFTLETPDGKKVSLKDFKGKVVLIDFWASWCGPCRRENPNVVAMYNRYKDKGFEILGVSLDRSKEPWIKAIADDKLTWPHVSDLKGWGSSAAALYGITSIPHTVLVDRDGRIVARQLRGEVLGKKLEEILGGK